MSLSVLRISAALANASRLGMEVAGRNLAGAADPAYSRQRAVPVALPGGVGILRIERLRAGLLDRAWRLRHQEAEGERAAAPLYARLEGLLSGPGALPERLAELEEGFRTVAERPFDLATRRDLLARAEALAAEFRDTATRLAELQAETRSRLRELVAEANRDLEQLASLNEALGITEPGSFERNRLLDRRDALLDHLSGLLEVRVVEEPAGRVAIYQGGVALLYGTVPRSLEIDGEGRLRTPEGRPLAPAAGALAAVGELDRERLPAFAGELDTLALSLLTGVNALHARGYGMDGGSGRAFFRGEGAATLRVSLVEPRQVAAAVASMESREPLGLGGIDPAASLSSQPLAVAPTSQGEIRVNGVSLPWDAAMSLEEILSSFASAGVKAQLEPVTGRILLERIPEIPGPPGIALEEVAGNLLEVLRLDGVPSGPGGAADGRLAQGLAEVVAERAGSFRELVVAAGSQAAIRRSSQERAEAAEAGAEEMRRRIAGVNSDEELLDLVRYQQAFAAAARLAAAADEMLAVLIRGR